MVEYMPEAQIKAMSGGLTFLDAPSRIYQGFCAKSSSVSSADRPPVVK
jgi:hypothetical protein